MSSRQRVNFISLCKMVGAILMLGLMGGCGNYAGVAEAEQQAVSADRLSNNDENGSSSISCNAETTVSNVTLPQEGQKLYAEQCESCHGSSGYGTPAGPSLIGCATCGDVETLKNRIATTMPTGSVSSCGLDCSQKTADYVMAAFNSQLADAKDTSTNPNACSLAGTNNEPDSKTYYKASTNLTSEVPPSPNQSVARAQSSTDIDLASEIDKMMETDAFYKRLMEIFNDVFLQDKYLPGEDAVNLLDANDYPQRRWYRDLGLDTSKAGHDRDLYYFLRDSTNDAVAEEILRLIAHVVKENRPFTEILTADYMMANAYSARAYGVYGQTTFKKLANPLDANYPEDPEDFQEVKIPGIPHAGVLTSAMFLQRFPTTATNLNRHRARKVFDFFLDTDILAIQGARPDQSVDLVSTTPTLDNPACTSCHDVMDPVASTFQNWDERGRYRRSRLSRDGWPSDIQPRGFNGKVMTLSGNVDSSLQWLGKEIVKDPRFARAIVKILYKGFVGDEPLSPPANDASDKEKAAYVTQRLYLGNIENDFVKSNYNLKVAIKQLLLSPYYRAKSAPEGALKVAGSARLLTPEMLDRKIKAVTGYAWKYSWASYTHLDKERGAYNQLYGGIDSDSVTKRIVQPNGLMASVQELMAAEMSCYVTARDFYKKPADRLLFPYVAMDTIPTNADGIEVQDNVDAIKKNIQYLHWRFFGENLSLSDAELEVTYQLFTDLLAQGKVLLADESKDHRYLDYRCRMTRDPKTNDYLPRADRIEKDENFAIRAWIGVLDYMLTDYRFLYE